MALRQAALGALRCMGQQQQQVASSSSSLLQQQAARRGMAGGSYVPKPDTSMDHVFGDSSFRLPFNFEPPSMFKTFTLTLVTLGVFGLPIWVMGYEDYQMSAFLERLEEAKAKKGPAAAESS